MLAEWIESLPEFCRPVATGAGFILILILARGGGIVMPLIFAVLVIASAHPLHDLVLGLLVIGLAILGGGLSGLAYSIAGRWLRPIPRVGPYLAGRGNRGTLHRDALPHRARARVKAVVRTA